MFHFIIRRRAINLSVVIGGIIVSSDRSGSGKTVITSGIMRALSKRLGVAPFKVGPDYIDPGYHRVATGEWSANLDLWLMGEEEVKRAFWRYSRGKDLAVVEGVMGLYDGVGLKYSTYEVSEVLRLPIVLLINCSNVSSTASAIVHGLKSFRNARVAGVIFNMVGSERHFSYCKEGLEGVKVLGYIPYSKELKLPSRHLGLHLAEEVSKAEEVVRLASELVEAHVDLDSLLEIARTAQPPTVEEEPKDRGSPSGKVAVAYDLAFSFYYRDNIEFLKARHEVVFFSPLKNEVVEDADAIYLGGGYPELYMGQLEANERTKRWIVKTAEEGKPVFGECGGLMYLSKELVDERGYKMVGLFDLTIKAKERLTIGYTSLEAVRDNLLVKSGGQVRGHEFHYSKPIDSGKTRFAFKNLIGKGIWNGMDGAVEYNSLGTYSHFYFRSFPPAL
jgi:cobyrinic acid a,c-diamide synthase